MAATGGGARETRAATGGGRDGGKAATEASGTKGATGGAAARETKEGASGARVDHAVKTIVRGGQLYSIPYKTASSSTRTYPTALAFGSHDPIMNRSTDKRSEAGSKFCATAVTSAGATKKPLSPYKPEAPRNRLKVEFKRAPKPFSSTLSFEYGAPAVAHDTHPYATTTKLAQKTATKRLETRVGFTNDGINAEVTKRAHKGLLA